MGATPLLAIDANNLTVRRYVRKPSGGLYQDKFAMEPESVKLLGTEEHRAGLEAVRQPPKRKVARQQGRTRA